jgi:hypothetical protein
MTNLKKTLLYNLIIFDFILLESSTKKISNFFIQKLEINIQKKDLKKKYLRIPVEETVKSVKRFIRLLYFIKKKKSLITFISNSDQNAELLKLLFKQFNLTCFITFNSDFTSNKFLKSAIFLDYPVTKSNFISLFFKRIFLLQSINSLENSLHYNMYKIFSTLDDYKKLIFLGLIIVSIFKK